MQWPGVQARGQGAAAGVGTSGVQRQPGGQVRGLTMPSMVWHTAEVLSPCFSISGRSANSAVNAVRLTPTSSKGTQAGSALNQRAQAAQHYM